MPELFSRAAAAASAGNFAEADRLYRAVLAAHPRQPEALHSLSVVRYQRGRHDEALSLIDRLLKHYPDFAEAHYSRGTMLQNLGRFEPALASFDRALAVTPDYREALQNRGIALSALKLFDEALASFDRVIALDRNSIDGNLARAYVLFELRRFAESLKSYDRVLALQPGHVVAHNNRGNTLRELGRHAEALASFDRALKLNPNYAEAHANRANTLKDLGRFEESLASCDRALAIQPSLPAALNNRGLALQEMQRFPEALESLDRAIALDPADADRRVTRATLLLLRGRFAEGWREYEWRRKQNNWRDGSYKGREWSGEDIAGKRIFLYSEQGLGDAIQFARFARAVSRLGAEVRLGARPRLERLLQRLDGEAIIVRDGERVPDFDLHLPLMSVPLVLGFDPDKTPAEVPYLAAEPALVERWASRLPSATLRVGVAWQGNQHWQGDDRTRSVPLRAFAPLARVPGVMLVSLQKEAGLEQLANLPAGVWVETLGSDFDAGPDAFVDTASVMMHLDLVVTSDTAVAHLAGALGRPVWIALRHVPEWRWMLDREDSPWYPTARLFRQRAPGDWDEVFVRIAGELARFATNKSLCAGTSAEARL